MKKLSQSLVAYLAAGLALLPATAFHPAATLANETVNVWITTGDQSKLLQQQASVSFSGNAPGAGTTITVDEGTTYQTMDGFGAAMTGSAAYVLNHDLNASQRDALLTDLFGPGGIHLSFMRHSIGASDFSAYGDFTYDDRPAGQTDTGLSSFSLGSDLTDVVPILKAALGKNSGLKVLGTPWSAPAWMKTNGNLRGGGNLNTTYSQAYANYFVKYVQAYAAQGVPIYAMTLQNEPLNSASYMSMLMQPADEAAFLKVIGPAFRAANLNTKLIVYDHNWDNPNNYVQNVFADATAAQYAAGSAWHGYSPASGLPNQTAVHNAYPAKDSWFTEITGNASGDFAGDLKWHVSNIIIGTTRNWAKSALEWNLALDQNSGPVNGGYSNGRGVVTINSSTGAVTRNEEYYALGHASKFVDQGAVRIASNSVAGGIENVAFRNPDGSKVLLALNNSASSITFKVQWSGQSFNYTLPAGAVATYKWAGSTTPPATTPTVSTTGTLAAFGTTTGTPSAAQTYAVSGTNLTAALTIGPLAGYEFSRTGGAPYAASLSLAPSGGTVASSTISVRLTGTTAGTFGGNIANASASATTRNVAATGTVSDPTPTSGITSGHVYEVVSQNSGKALDVTDVSTANGARIQQWTYGGGGNQQWRAENLGGYYRFTNLNSGKVMEVAGSSTANGAAVQQQDWSGGDNQLWSLTKQSDGSYQVLNKLSGKALDVASASTANGGVVQQWDWSGSGGSNQKWLFTDLGTARVSVALATVGSAPDTRLQAYPTVAGQQVYCDYDAPTAQSLSLRVLDLTGRVVINQPDLTAVTGTNHFSVSVATLATGSYLLQLTTPAGSLTRRIIITR